MLRFSCLTVGVLGVLTCERLFSQVEYPDREWKTARPADVGLDPQKLELASQRALQAGGAGMIVRHGRLVHHWGDVGQRYDLKSTSKSIGVTALGLALGDGKLQLDDRAAQYHPALGIPPETNAQSGWSHLVTIKHLATQTAGFAKPGGYQPLLFEPGTAWHYSDGGPNWLAECITHIYGRDVQEVLFERVFAPIGISENDLRWRENQYREHEMDGVKRREFGSGVHANVDAMARIGLLYLRQGKWKDTQLLPEEFVKVASHSLPEIEKLPVFQAEAESGEYGEASKHYGLLWWNNADGTLAAIPRDAYWSWGLYDSLILVIPSLDMVATRTGKSWDRKPGSRHYDVLAPFFEAVVASVVHEPPVTDTWQAPYPPSELISQVKWAPADATLHLAEGSDNWPVTWAEDDWLYTAYGDGWGFEPRVEKKLSLGLARVAGTPLTNQSLQCENVRSDSIEQVGQGEHGLKASGLLSIDGVLYMLVRNADNAQLAWSSDHGLNWKWSDWKFQESFGCPTFLNAGKNYADAPDRYVYIYSLDNETAYDPADQMVLARVPVNRITEQAAYEFFSGIENGLATWSRSIADRQAVFQHPERCYRSGVTYSSVLGRYLWCQVLPQSQHSQGPRFEGGFGIYDAPNPWGPWTTVFFTEHWDVGPGETCSIPMKWMSEDGTSGFLLSSTNDSFSARAFQFVLRSH